MAGEADSVMRTNPDLLRRVPTSGRDPDTMIDRNWSVGLIVLGLVMILRRLV